MHGPAQPAYLDKAQAWVKGPDGVPVMGKSGEAFGDESSKKAKTHAEWVHQVNECVSAIDEGVGQLIAALKESGQLENSSSSSRPTKVSQWASAAFGPSWLRTTPTIVRR